MVGGLLHIGWKNLDTVQVFDMENPEKAAVVQSEGMLQPGEGIQLLGKTHSLLDNADNCCCQLMPWDAPSPMS